MAVVLAAAVDDDDDDDMFDNDSRPNGRVSPCSQSGGLHDNTEHDRYWAETFLLTLLPFAAD